MNFEISDKVNPDKVFLVHKSQLEGRLEPEYYTPTLRKLENKVREQSDNKLRHFIKGIAGGATPPTTKKSKYYTTREKGFPFLRVQNLQTNGKLNFDNLKFINKETHNGLLKRSQVEAGDLLIKITGVGRMAIASVAPEGFVGNTNQHMVVVKTESREISEYLANYLNLDLVEKLASRRATGATRPALDYQALKSIPIIEGIDFSIIEKAYNKKAQKEAEAEELLNSIDDYLLSELGIELPERDDSLENRIFKTPFSKGSGTRFDPLFFYDNFLDELPRGKFETDRLSNFVKYIENGFAAGSKIQSSKEDGILQIRPTNINSNREFIFEKNIYVREEILNLKKENLCQKGEVLFNNTNSQELVGKSILFDLDIKAFCSNHITRIRTGKSLNPRYLVHILNLFQRQKVFFQLCTNWNNQSGVNTDVLKSLPIPIPKIKIQNEIANHISKLRERAKQLKKEAQHEVENARKQIEEMILQKDSVSA